MTSKLLCSIDIDDIFFSNPQNHLHNQFQEEEEEKKIKQ